MKAHNLQAGERFGKLVVVGQLDIPGANETRWICQCDCGVVSFPSGHRLHSGKSKSCGCAKWEQEARTKAGAKMVKKDAAWNQFHNQYRQNAKHRGLDFPLTVEQVKEIASRPCFYCGVAPRRNDTYYRALKSLQGRTGVTAEVDVSHRVIYANGIDRVNSAQGYSPENCVAACDMCNVSKLDYSLDEWKAWIVRVYQNLIATN